MMVVTMIHTNLPDSNRLSALRLDAICAVINSVLEVRIVNLLIFTSIL